MTHHGRRPGAGRPPALLAPGVLIVALLVAGCGGDGASSAGSAAETRSPAGSPATSGATPDTTAGASTMLPDGYQPLWPFADAAAVTAWQRRSRAAGERPWQLDADRTALRFTRDFLGFKEIDRVVGRQVNGRDARITVGYASPEADAPASVAKLHLIKVGGDDGPWEVVGTDDETMSLTTPAYGSAVRSPVTVGGRITGVDENIQVKVLRTGSNKPLGTHCCLPAGGDNRPWSTKVAYRGGPGRTLTIVAWTGGHIADVERFAITGVRG